MNKKSTIYRRPLVAERDKLIAFLKEHWREDHLFVQDPEWFDWQHRSSDGQYFHVICAYDGDEKIVGFLGVLPLTGDVDFIGTGIWVIDKNCLDKTVGLSLFRALEQHYPAQYIGSIGVNVAAASVLRMLGHKSGIAKTFYISGKEIEEPVLSQNLPYKQLVFDESINISELKSIDKFGSVRSKHYPQKSLAWYKWRYCDSAPFKYRFFGVEKSNENHLLVVVREFNNGSASFLRIVDMFGDLELAGNYAGNLQQILMDEGHEYCELLVGGSDLTQFENNGFLEKPEVSIIPAYLDPLLMVNAELGWTIKLSKPAREYPAYIFRGDGDQDRPNRVGLKAPTFATRPL